jgi:PhnB protein
MLNNNEVSRRRFLTAALSTAALATLAGDSMADNNKTNVKGNSMSTALTPYLLFDGHCKQAMEFYQSCFGGELTITKVKDSPAKDFVPAAQHEKVVNARLKSASVEVSASDWMRPDETPVRGNTVCLYLSGGTLQDLKTAFGKLSEGADITDPLKEMFFGTYGALNDKFGVRWMFQANAKA